MKVKEHIQGIKPYIPGVLKEGAIKLASNENPLGPSPKALAVLRAGLKKIALYPDGGSVALRQAIAKEYALMPENVIVGNGSDEIFLFIAGAYIDVGDEMVTSTVTFSEYAFATKVFNGIPVYAELGADGRYNLKALLEKITPKTKVVFIANPNNPTGTYCTDPELREFLDKVPQDIVVVIDEAYCEYVEAPDYPNTVKLLQWHKNLVITRTFSKIYGLAGLRVGYALAHQEVIAALNKAREPFNVNSLAQAAACAALEDETHVIRSRQNNARGKKYVYAQLRKLGLRFYATEANFVFIEIPFDAQEAFKQLMECGVTIRPMTSFGINNAIRVTIGTSKQNTFFIQKLKEILKK